MILLDPMGHLVSDVSLEELHIFATGIGMRREWFQDKRLPHYDLMSSTKRRAALAAGAKMVKSKELVQRMIRQGPEPIPVGSVSDSMSAGNGCCVALYQNAEVKR